MARALKHYFRTMKVDVGTNFIVRGLRWNEDWEFDCPVLLLSPFIRYSPCGETIEHLVEDLGIDASLDGEVKSHDYSKEFEWRGWKLDYLNKVWNSAISGKKFPKKNYQAEEWKLTFVQDAEFPEDLTFTMEKLR